MPFTRQRLMGALYKAKTNGCPLQGIARLMVFKYPLHLKPLLHAIGQASHVWGHQPSHVWGHQPSHVWGHQPSHVWGHQPSHVWGRPPAFTCVGPPAFTCVGPPAFTCEYSLLLNSRNMKAGVNVRLRNARKQC